MSYMNAQEAALNTEIEILADVFDMEPEEFDNYVTDDDDDHDLEAVENWDGSPLDEREIQETNINGFTDNGFDRPLQLTEEMGYEDALRTGADVITRQHQDFERLQAENNALRMQLDPGYQERMRAQEDSLVAAFNENPRQFIHQMHANMQSQARADHVNASLGEAHKELGEEFEDAYNALLSQPHNDPRARAVVQGIYDSPSPGRALMRWYGEQGGPRGGGDYGRSRSFMPSLNSQTPSSYSRSAPRFAPRSQGASRRSESMPFEEHDDIGGFDPRAEREVMASVWR
jgi:hypothetical protein